MQFEAETGDSGTQVEPVHPLWIRSPPHVRDALPVTISVIDPWWIGGLQTCSKQSDVAGI